MSNPAFAALDFLTNIVNATLEILTKFTLIHEENKFSFRKTESGLIHFRNSNMLVKCRKNDIRKSNNYCKETFVCLEILTCLLNIAK
jgi:hypothetical protein